MFRMRSIVLGIPTRGQMCRHYQPSLLRSTRSFVGKKDAEKLDFWTNDGIVEGVWIFSRHGDRTPSRPLSPSHRREEEAAYWMTKLPVPDSATVYERFSQYFPVNVTDSYKSNETFIDTVRNPFGFLTNKGILQLNQNGLRFFKRYNNHAHHFPECSDWKTPNDLLSVWNVKVYSTNYLRTIMSAQSFLDGMFGTHIYEPTNQDRVHNFSVCQEQNIPKRIVDRHSDQLPTVTIQVRDLKSDPLNAFDRNPELIADLISEVMLEDDFLQGDGHAAPLAARLANILPGLVKPKTSTDFALRSPSGINWVEAADHFVCRSAHDLEFVSFTDFESDDHISATLNALLHPTLAHLSWRFRKWYQHKRLLSVIAAPPLREIADQILTTPSLALHERRPFVIYSCHDITILGLLYGLGADFLQMDDLDHKGLVANEIRNWRWWPPYGSTLVFELVRIRDTPSIGPESHVVRVLLNGKPVRSVYADKSLPPLINGTPTGMLHIEDFERLVGDLEKVLGHDYKSLFGYN